MFIFKIGKSNKLRATFIFIKKELLTRVFRLEKTILKF